MTLPGKLVRDQIPTIIEASGAAAVVRRLSEQERLPALLDKLQEESHELLEARGLDERAEELADVYEVLRAIAAELGLAWADVERIAHGKRADRGGFELGLWLEAADAPPTSS